MAGGMYERVWEHRRVAGVFGVVFRERRRGPRGQGRAQARALGEEGEALRLMWQPMDEGVLLCELSRKVLAWALRGMGAAGLVPPHWGCWCSALGRSGWHGSLLGLGEWAVARRRLGT